ncbi:MAG: DUF4304 domain-containing protein [Acidobacteria bacterium]|nr:DUF4304 domain-containing protein [Acidobacteriota bacterium]
MQESLKRLIAELHAAYFKPNGFKKERQRFRRDVDVVMQEVEFQSSSWNSSGGPVTFFVNISVGFADIPMKDGKTALTGSGRVGSLVPGAPAQFDLTSVSYESIRGELLVFIPQALSELPKHYEDVRGRAREGWHTPIPLPDTWRA